MTNIVTRCCLLALLLPVVGCFYNKSEPVPRIEIEQLEDWPHDAKTDQGTPGIDFGSVWYLREAEPLNKPFAIIWVDDQFTSSSGTGSGTHEFQNRKRTVGLENGKTIVIECHVESGKEKPTIELTIDGQRCDFEQGNFFLISTIGKTTKIKQTDRDIGLKGMRFDLDSIQETAKTDEEIREFFTAASANKPQP